MVCCGRSVYSFTDRLETRPENSNANKIGIDLSVLYYTIIFSERLLEFLIFRPITSSVQVIRRGGAHCLWLRCLDPCALPSLRLETLQPLGLICILPLRCVWKWCTNSTLRNEVNFCTSERKSWAKFWAACITFLVHRANSLLKLLYLLTVSVQTLNLWLSDTAVAKIFCCIW